MEKNILKFKGLSIKDKGLNKIENNYKELVNKENSKIKDNINKDYISNNESIKNSKSFIINT